MTRGLQIVVLLISIVLLGGLLWSVIGAVQHWLIHGEVPQGEWWQFLVAIPIIGVVALTFEAYGEVIGRLFGINKPSTPKWMEYLGVLTIVVSVIAVLVIFSMTRT
jgi:hypothetical protein